MNNTDLSIIIPSYQEEENLRIILPRINDTMNTLNIKYELLIIDTIQKKDNTDLVCAENNAQYLNRTGGDSYGNAVRTGIKQANGQHILFMDADGSHSPEMISNLWSYRKEYDIVIASRYIKGGGSDNSKTLIAMSYIVNRIYSIFLGIKCRDVSNSFKLYKAKYLKTLSLNCQEFDIIEEILVKIKRKKTDLNIKEVPYFFKERMFGHTKRNLFIFMLLYLKTLFRLKIEGFKK
jgi:dolichol-phosphate mannosyltransferase